MRSIVDWRSWRGMTWVLVIVNALFLLLFLAMGLSVPSNCAGLTGSAFDDCMVSWAPVIGFGVAVLVGLWLIVDVILGVLWAVTWRPRPRDWPQRFGRNDRSVKPRTRDCPQCLWWIDGSLTVCPECGYEFVGDSGGLG